MQNTMQLIKPCIKTWHVNWLETSCIQQLQLQGSLINEQDIHELNPLFALVQDPEAQHKSEQCYSPPKEHHKTIVQYIIP
jgi:hypothetical protein